MNNTQFWTLAVVVCGALEEALRTGLIPAQYAHYVSPIVTFVGFLVQRRGKA